MENSKENMLQEEVHTAAPVKKTSEEFPAHLRYPHSGPETGNVVAGYPAQPAGLEVLPLTVGADSCTVVCPACHQTVQTDVRVVPTTRTDVFARLLAVFECCCTPYCVDSSKAKHHYCPKCKAFIAAYDT